jgi:hypothetical protein
VIGLGCLLNPVSTAALSPDDPPGR